MDVWWIENTPRWFIPPSALFFIMDAQFLYETRAWLTALDGEIFNDPDANRLYICGRLFVFQFKGKN